MHTHKIVCEMCNKITASGLIAKDNGLRDRYFCSTKCYAEKIVAQLEKEEKKKARPWWSLIA